MDAGADWAAGGHGEGADGSGVNWAMATKYIPTQDEVRRHIVASLKLEGIETSVEELHAIQKQQEKGGSHRSRREAVQRS